MTVTEDSNILKILTRIFCRRGFVCFTWVAVSYKLVEYTETFLFLKTVFKLEGRPRKEGTPVSMTVKDTCKSVLICISVNSVYLCNFHLFYQKAGNFRMVQGKTPGRT